MRLRVHFHSDAASFAGCENMLANFLNDGSFMSVHDVSFSYRYTEEYERGLRRRVPGPVCFLPLRMMSGVNLHERAMQEPAPKQIALRIGALFVQECGLLVNTVKLYLVLRRRQIAILHINNGGYPGAYSCMSAVIAGRLAGIKRIVYVVNNEAVPYRRPRRWLDYGLDRLVAALSTVFVTGSRHTAGRLGSILALPPRRVFTIPNGISLRTATESPEDWCRRLGLAMDRVLIGVVAVLEERKGHIYLLRALKLMREQNPGRRMPYVVVEGQGPCLAGLRTFVVQARLDDCVKFIGTEENIANLMGAMDLLVLPSIGREDFPNVVLEAMGFGKPVVASRICGVPEQIEDRQTGIMVEPGDVEELAMALGALLNDPARMRSMGEAARLRFQERFTATIAVSNYLALYRALMTDGACAPRPITKDTEAGHD